jgi:4-hydroxy-2-oxoheptanedioate aldolase
MANVLTSFAPRLRSGKPAFASWIGLADAMSAEVLAREDFDCSILDVQHGLHTVSSVIAGIGAAAAAGKPTLIRIGVEEFPNASRYLDSGAAGVIAPMVNTIADARRFAGFMKYPPMGERSWGPHRALGMSALNAQDYLKQANGHTLAIAMIETREAMAILDDILALPGIDGVFVGPSDLSIALSNGGHIDAFHADVDGALKHVVARAKAHGKLAAAFCMTGARAGQLAGWGFNLLSIGTDMVFMRLAAQQELAAARGSAAGTAQVAKSY